MTTTRRNDVDAIKAAVARAGSMRGAARDLGISDSSVRYAMRSPATPDKGFDVASIPTSNLPIDELIRRRCDEFARREATEKASKLIPVKVKLDGPIGIVHFGDPHVDDPGCDFPLLREHVRLVNDTPGMLGACIGDYTNNWTGRLERLYAKQETKQSDAVRLAEWFIKQVPWLYLVAGNHDVWSGTLDACKVFAKLHGALYKDHGVRLALKFNNGRECRINARHTFNGFSQFNANHGAVKASRFGYRDHVYVSGHTHTASYQKIPAIGSDYWHHLLQVGAYKRYDDYADQGGFPDYNAAAAMVTIIDPTKGERDWIQVFDDVAEAADYLTFKRRKAA